jgi:hypothetical protein
MHSHRNRLLKACLPPVLLAVVLATGPAATSGEAKQDPIYIIVNKASPDLGEISISDIRRIFQRDQTRIKGAPVVPIHAVKDSPLRTAFNERVLGMSLSEELGYWEKQKIQFGKEPPTETRNTLRAVYYLRSGISYCFASEYKPAAVRILLKIE